MPNFHMRGYVCDACAENNVTLKRTNPSKIIKLLLDFFEIYIHTPRNISL